MKNQPQPAGEVQNSQKKKKTRIIVASITWNKNYWRDSYYVNKYAGHKYAREYPGHEAVNFKFDKNSIDDEKNIYGFIRWTNHPKKLAAHSVIIFFSRNLDENEGQIVGIYGDVDILTKPKKHFYPGFEKDEAEFNVSAKKDLSMLFPIRLKAEKYSGNFRLSFRAGYVYADEDFAGKIIDDEIKELKKSGRRLDEYDKLKRIYTFITGKEYKDDDYSDDIQEQEEILKELRQRHDREKDLQEIKEYIANAKTGEAEKVRVNGGERYARDNKIIARLKRIRGEKCQICGLAIIKKDGSPYTEAAHIKAKSDRGAETPENLIILCPNHHKEFDLGDKEIISLTQENFRFKLNGQVHEIDLAIK